MRLGASPATGFTGSSLSTGRHSVYTLVNIPCTIKYIPGTTFHYLFQQNKSYYSSRRLGCDCWWSRWNGTLPSSAIPATRWSIHAYHTIHIQCICQRYTLYIPKTYYIYIYQVYTMYIQRIYNIYTWYMQCIY